MLAIIEITFPYAPTQIVRDRDCLQHLAVYGHRWATMNCWVQTLFYLFWFFFFCSFYSHPSSCNRFKKSLSSDNQITIDIFLLDWYNGAPDTAAAAVTLLLLLPCYSCCRGRGDLWTIPMKRYLIDHLSLTVKYTDLWVLGLKGAQ